jgi:hypothetical protein
MVFRNSNEVKLIVKTAMLGIVCDFLLSELL